jgi:hypothetical protein
MTIRNNWGEQKSSVPKAVLSFPILVAEWPRSEREVLASCLASLRGTSASMCASGFERSEASYNPADAASPCALRKSPIFGRACVKLRKLRKSSGSSAYRLKSKNSRRPMKSDETHRLSKFALTITGGHNEQSSKREPGKRIELFRSPDGNVFVDLYDGATRQTWPVQSKTFSQWLAGKYFETTNRIATPAQLRAAINQIEAQVQVDSPEREVFRRVGKFGDRLYLDLADDKWSAIEIDASGWRVVQNPLVRFVRAPAMLPVPVPEKGGSIEMLRSLVNVADEQDFVLVVAWLLAAMHRDIPKPAMAIRGGEGSAKSSLMDILRGLIDPHNPPYTALPRTEIKLRSAAAEAYCQAYDNVSGLTLSMSDALCRFVTDGSNQPVIINGISEIIMRPDLADRCVFIDCDPIPDLQRRTQADIMTTFAKGRPQILGVLLDAVAHGLQKQSQVEPTRLPRMADFALAVTACETRFWPAGTFRTAYDINRAEIVEALIEGDPVASAVRLLLDCRDYWEGQASDLDIILRAISGNLGDAKNWPADPRILANKLRQLAPALMKAGIDVRFSRARDHDRKRLITIAASRPDAAIKEEAISASAASEKPVSGHKEGRNEAGGEDHASPIPETTSNQPTGSGLAHTADAADAAEAAKSDLSKATPPNVTAQAADASIKNKSIEFVSRQIIGGRPIPVLRHRRHGTAKKPKKSPRHCR